MSDAQAAEKDAGITDAQIEWREWLGQRLMLAMTCQHGSDYFGSGAVCETCFANVQRIGHLIERIATQAWDEGFNAACDASTDPFITQDIEAQRENPYRVIPTGVKP